MAYTIPRSATESEIAQAQHLIARGKEGAAQGDPKMLRIISGIKYLSQEQVRTHIRRLKAAGADVSQVDVTKTIFGGANITGVKSPTTFTKEISIAPQSVLEVPTEPKGFLEKAEAELSYRRGRTSGISPTELFAIGIGSSVVGTLQFGKDIVTSPIETIKKTGTGVYSLATGKSGDFGASLGMTLQREPTYALGFVASEIATFGAIAKAPKLVTWGGDIVRTKGLTKLKTSDIIAPEFIELGQTYPKISKGQTAGELLGEFKMPKQQYGVTQMTGFTASPKSFAKETDILKGTSELPGLYQSPKVSPSFLMVGGESESKLFSFNVFDTFRPTIAKVKPQSFELVSGVDLKQIIPRGRIGRYKIETPIFPKSMSDFKNLFSKAEVGRYGKDIRGEQLLKFYEKAPKGKSYLPFMKTEKESIIPFGTKMELVDKRFFIEFEKRKIPIFEYKTDVGDLIGITKKATKGKGSKGLVSMEDFSKSLSRGRLKQKSIFTPLDSYSLSKQFSRSNLLGTSLKFPRVSRRGGRKPLSRDPLRLPSYSDYRKSFKGYFPSSYAGYSTSKIIGDGIGGFYLPPLKKPPSKKKKKQLRILGKKIRLDEKMPELSLGRKYKRTPSIGQVLKFDIGLKQTKVSKRLEETGLFGRAYFKPVKIPNLMGSVVRKKRKQK